jgi:phage gp46-like protein
MEVLIRADEACQPDPFLLWDSVWDQNTGIADWRLAGPNAPQNSGGLAATAALATAVTLCLFSDAAMPANHPLAKYIADGDPRGWWGDGVDVRTDLGEGPLGSLLWILFRMPCNAATAMWAQMLAAEALAPLQGQGAVVEIDCSAAVVGLNTMALEVALYGRNGQKLYDRKFDLIWDQVTAAAAA